MTAVGIDVGKAALHVAIDGVASVMRFANSATGVRKLLRRPEAVVDARIVVEATGGYEDALLEAWCDARWWVSRVNSRQARDFARATGEIAKTDAIDARLPCLLSRLFSDRLRRFDVAPPWQRELLDWLRRRGQVVVTLQAHKQQAAMTSPLMRKLMTRTIAGLTGELAAIDRSMQALFKAHTTPALHSAKGMGPIFQATSLALLPELGTLTRRCGSRSTWPRSRRCAGIRRCVPTTSSCVPAQSSARWRWSPACESCSPSSKRGDGTHYAAWEVQRSWPETDHAQESC